MLEARERHVPDWVGRAVLDHMSFGVENLSHCIEHPEGRVSWDFPFVELSGSRCSMRRAWVN